MISLKKILPAILFALLFAQTVFAERDFEPCDIEFDFMSVKEGSVGETFILYGKWGDTQGEKLPAINRAHLEPLEVVSWSDSQLTVRIPTSLSSGIHKVGVYCNDPRKGGTYGTDWKFFTVKSREESGQSSQTEMRERQSSPEEASIRGDTEIGDPLQAYEKGNNEIWIILAGIIAAAFLLYSRRKPKQ